MDLKVRKLNSLYARSKGLLGEKKIFPVFFKTRFGIHTFFLRSPIDTIILDDKNKAVILKENLVPNRIFFWNPKYNKVIELPSGFIKEKRIKIGTEINIL